MFWQMIGDILESNKLSKPRSVVGDQMEEGWTAINRFEGGGLLFIGGSRRGFMRPARVMDGGGCQLIQQN